MVKNNVFWIANNTHYMIVGYMWHPAIHWPKTLIFLFDRSLECSAFLCLLGICRRPPISDGVAWQYQHTMLVSFVKEHLMNVWKPTRSEPLHPCILKVILENELRRIEGTRSGDMGNEVTHKPAAVVEKSSGKTIILKEIITTRGNLEKIWACFEARNYLESCVRLPPFESTFPRGRYILSV